VNRTGIFLAAAAFIAALDQAAKALVATRMTIGQSIPLIPGCLSLTYIRNRGIAFGMFSDGSGSFKIVLLSLSTLVALGFLVWLLRETRPDDLFGGGVIGLVAGGAVGNLVDRLRMGEVTDFIDAYWRTHHWPFFNVADSAITVGVILLMAQQLFAGDRREGRENHAPDAP
jgi:signal peptidase II